MIIHTVLLRLSRPVNDEQRERFLAGLRAFAANPPQSMGPADVIVDAGLRPEGRSVTEAMLQGRFADEQAFHAYLADPRHTALVEELFVPNLDSWLSLQQRV